MRTKRAKPATNQFLDVEAGVDDEIDPDKEEDEDFQDDFIDDTNVEQLSGELENEDDTAVNFYDQLLAKAYDRSRLGTYTGIRLRYGGESPTKSILLGPGIDDYPLWRVECRIGFEEIIIASLLGSAEDIHGLRSAFTRGTIRGCIYLECDMNPRLIHLLEETPGIGRANKGLQCRQIDLEDSLALLTMEKVQSHFESGQWVQITKGLYKGDIGLLSVTYSFGADVLVVPRLEYHPADNKHKRKASAVRHHPKLFDPLEFRTSSTTKLIQYRDGSYNLGRFPLAHGLLLKTYDYHSITSGVYVMPWFLFSMFSESGHPEVDVSHMPRPQEWSFVPDEKVIICNSDKRGIIRGIVDDYIEVECQNIGIHRFFWQLIRKDIKIGDFVSVMGGHRPGYKGWVIERTEDIVVVLDKVVHDTMSKDSIEAHVNCLIVTDPPFHHTSLSMPSLINHHGKAQRHPWCGTNVIISKIGHAQKGDTFQVVNVLFNQPNPSGLRLELQYLRFTPYTPFQQITVDYEDVVEESSFYALNRFVNTRYNATTSTLPVQQCATSTILDGSSTPMPTASSSTPAWDPSSRAPLGINLMASPVHDLGQAQETVSQLAIRAVVESSPPAPQHVLLNDALVNVQLNVIVNGGEYKQRQLHVSISYHEGRLGILYTRRTMSYLLQPEWVTPKYPNAGYDNALLIVIKGEYCVIINYTEDFAELLTEEILELSTDFLCIVNQPNTVKDRNRDVTQNLRNSYRKKSRS